MALTIQENKSAATKDCVIADRKLWLNAEGQVVEDGDPAARSLFCTPGQQIPKDRAKEVGLKVAKKATKKPAPKKTSNKKASAAATKKGK